MNFSMATKENRKQGDGTWAEHTEWHSIVVWGKRAEGLNKIIKKGSKVTVVGAIRASEWTDKENVTRKKFEIHASEVIPQNGLIPRDGQSTQHRDTHADNYQPPPRQANNAPRQTKQSAQPQPPVDNGYDGGDDIPF